MKTPDLLRRKLLGFLSLALLLLGSACTRTPPLEQVIEADTALNYSLWYAKAARELTPEQERLFQAALTELKLQSMIRGTAEGAEGVENRLLRRIHGKPLGTILRYGLRQRSDRLAAELKDAETARSHNQGLNARIRDEEKARELESAQQRLDEKISRLRQEISSLTAALRSAGVEGPPVEVMR